MKRSLLFLLLCVTSIVLTGCVKEEEYKPKTDRGTTTTTKKVEVEEKESEISKINKSVSYQTYVTSNNDVAVIIKNESEKTLDITANIKYLTASNKTISNAHETVYAIKPNKETVVIFNNKEWDTYEIKLDNKESSKIPVYDNIKYKNKTTNKDVEIEVTNYSKEPIDGISFSIAYYDEEDELIGFVRSDTISIEENITGIIKVDYPKNKYDRKLKFNRYVVYLNEVYKNKEAK